MSTDNFGQPGQPSSPNFPGYTPPDASGATPPAPGFPSEPSQPLPYTPPAAPAYTPPAAPPATPSFPPAAPPAPAYTPPASPMDLPPVPGYGAGPDPAGTAGSYGGAPGGTVPPAYTPQPAPDYGQSQPSGYGAPGYGQPAATPYPPAPDFGQVPYAGTVNPYGTAPAGGYQLATWGQRAIGGLIDYGIPYLVVSVFNYSTVFSSGRVGVLSYLVDLVALAYIIYNSGIQTASKAGVSWGHKIAKVRLVREDGQPLTQGLAIGRALLHFIDQITCFVGWLFPLWDQKRQTLADKIVHTVVISDPTV